MKNVQVLLMSIMLSLVSFGSFAKAPISVGITAKDLAVSAHANIFALHVKAGVDAKVIRKNIVAAARLTGKAAKTVLDRGQDVVLFTGKNVYKLAQAGTDLGFKVLNAGYEGSKRAIIFTGKAARYLAKNFTLTLGKVAKLGKGVVIATGNIAKAMFNRSLEALRYVGTSAHKLVRSGAQIAYTSAKGLVRVFDSVLRSAGTLLGNTAKGALTVVKYGKNALFYAITKTANGTIKLTKAALEGVYGIGVAIVDITFQAGKFIIGNVVNVTKAFLGLVGNIFKTVFGITAEVGLGVSNVVLSL